MGSIGFQDNSKRWEPELAGKPTKIDDARIRLRKVAVLTRRRAGPRHGAATFNRERSKPGLHDLAVLKAKIQITNPKIRARIGPKPTMSLGK